MGKNDDKPQPSIKAGKLTEEQRARWSKAIMNEAKAYQEARTGDQLARLGHFKALLELAAAEPK